MWGSDTNFFGGRNISKFGLSWWLSGEESTCQCRWCRFAPWVRKIPWRRKWQPTEVFLPGEFHGQRSLAIYSPWGRTRVGHNLATKTTTYQSPCVRERKKIETSVFLDTSHSVVQHFYTQNGLFSLLLLTVWRVPIKFICLLCKNACDKKPVKIYFVFLCFSFEKWGTWPASRSSFCRQGALFGETGVQFIQRESGERTQHPFRKTHAGPASTGSCQVEFCSAFKLPDWLVT